jgi:spore germination protein
MNQYGFDGINIDYEALRRNQKNQFTQFIQLLGERLDEEDKLLGVAIHPKTGENKPDEANGSQAQDLAALGEASDHLYLMTYDEHNDSSVPGAISSLDWTEEVVTYALSQGVSSEKLFLGVPLYGYEWNLSSGSARGLEYTEVLPLTQGVSLRTDSASLEKTFSYQRGASTFEVWYNDADSVAGKAKLAADMGLKGIALWRLGREDPNIWPTLLELEESD